MFIPIDRTTLIQKNDGMWSFFYEIKASIHLFEWWKWIYGAQSWKEKRLLCESIFILVDGWTLILENVGIDVFLMKLKCQYHLSQLRECVYSAQSLKNRRLLCKSIFIPIDRQNLILKNGRK